MRDAPRDVGADRVDRALDEWALEWPGLDLGTIAVMARLGRLMSLIEPEIEAALQEFGITRASFDTIAVLRRAGPPYRLTPSQLAARLMRSSGTLTVRIDHLERDGLVRRMPDPTDGRGVLVALTHKGHRLIDAVVPVHLANQRRLLAPLSVPEREQLAGLLRRLLLTWEPADVPDDLEAPQPCSELGLRVVAPLVGARMRRSVGLVDRVGLLVRGVDSNSPASRAGIAAGDLLVRLAGQELHSIPQLQQIVSASSGRAVNLTLVRVNEEHGVVVCIESPTDSSGGMTERTPNVDADNAPFPIPSERG